MHSCEIDKRGLSRLGNFRNSPVHCDVFPAIDVESWKTDSPALQVPEAILIQTLEKGTEGLAQRRREEYALWENSESVTCVTSGIKSHEGPMLYGSANLGL